MEGLLTADGPCHRRRARILSGLPTSKRNGRGTRYGPGHYEKRDRGSLSPALRGGGLPGDSGDPASRPAADRNPVYSAWGGDKAAVPISITGAPGTAYRLTGKLFQVAGGLSAKIGDSIDLGTGELPESAARTRCWRSRSPRWNARLVL